MSSTPQFNVLGRSLSRTSGSAPSSQLREPFSSDALLITGLVRSRPFSPQAKAYHNDSYAQEQQCDAERGMTLRDSNCSGAKPDRAARQGRREKYLCRCSIPTLLCGCQPQQFSSYAGTSTPSCREIRPTSTRPAATLTVPPVTRPPNMPARLITSATAVAPIASARAATLSNAGEEITNAGDNISEEAPAGDGEHSPTNTADAGPTTTAQVPHPLIQATQISPRSALGSTSGDSPEGPGHKSRAGDARQRM